MVLDVCETITKRCIGSKSVLNLGLMYYKEQAWIVSGKALHWFEIAAEKQYSDAQMYLGVMYLYGKKVPINYDKAWCWFNKAASLNNKFAFYYIGEMYYYGQGVEMNTQKAIHWFRLSAINGVTDAQRFLAEHYQIGVGVPPRCHLAIEWYKRAAIAGDDTSKRTLELMLASPFLKSKALWYTLSYLEDWLILWSNWRHDR
jgi:uncharacterized protein